SCGSTARTTTGSSPARTGTGATPTTAGTSRCLRPHRTSRTPGLCTASPRPLGRRCTRRSPPSRSGSRSCRRDTASRRTACSRGGWPRRGPRWSERRIAQIRGRAPGGDDPPARGFGEGGAALFGGTPLVLVPRVLEEASGARGEQIRGLLRGGAQVVAEHPARGERRAHVPALARIAGGVEQSGGLHLMVLPAQSVQVLERGGATAGGMLVVVLEDVVVLGGGRGGTGAAGHRADGVAQPQLQSHRGAGPVGLGRHREVRATGPVG